MRPQETNEDASFEDDSDAPARAPVRPGERAGTARMRAAADPGDASELALRALVWTLGEPDRAQRLLDTTGLFPADLRARAGEPAVLGAVIGFICNHEPDLLACAADLGVAPETLAAAGDRL